MCMVGYRGWGSGCPGWVRQDDARERKGGALWRSRRVAYGWRWRGRVNVRRLSFCLLNLCLVAQARRGRRGVLWACTSLP